MLSYALMMLTGSLYGPVILIDFFIVAPRRNYKLCRFTKLLLQNQKLALSTQLWFAVAVCLACFIRQMQSTFLIYQLSLMTAATFIATFTFLSSILSYYQHIPRPRLILASVSGIIVSTIYTLRMHENQLQKLEGLLHICAHVNKHLHHPGFPFHRKPGMVVPVSFLIAFAAVWGCFWFHRRSKKFDHGNYSLGEIIFGYLLIFCNALPQLGAGVFSMVMMMMMRNNMMSTQSGEYKSNEWEIGQLIAPFTWGPLLVAIAYDAPSMLWGQGGELDADHRWCREWLPKCPANCPRHHEMPFSALWKEARWRVCKWARRRLRLGRGARSVPVRLPLSNPAAFSSWALCYDEGTSLR